MSKEWGIAPWVQAGRPETAGSPHWPVWQHAYLWAQAERQKYLAQQAR